jgi:hypothetical protein
VVENLPSKCKVLNSIPSIIKTLKKKVFLNYTGSKFNSTPLFQKCKCYTKVTSAYYYIISKEENTQNILKTCEMSMLVCKDFMAEE